MKCWKDSLTAWHSQPIFYLYINLNLLLSMTWMENLVHGNATKFWTIESTQNWKFRALWKHDQFSSWRCIWLQEIGLHNIPFTFQIKFQGDGKRIEKEKLRYWERGHGKNIWRKKKGRFGKYVKYWRRGVLDNLYPLYIFRKFYCHQSKSQCV